MGCGAGSYQAGLLFLFEFLRLLEVLRSDFHFLAHALAVYRRFGREVEDFRADSGQLELRDFGSFGFHIVGAALAANQQRARDDELVGPGDLAGYGVPLGAAPPTGDEFLHIAARRPGLDGRSAWLLSSKW